MRKVSANRIQAVLKITERCNINCTYCYMFNLGNDDYLRHSPYMSEETVHAVAKFLRQGAIDFSAGIVEVILHGGEPLMLKPARFRKALDIFKATISDVAEVVFILQTNAMLMDEEWIDIMAEYEIHVGVSVDGPRELHDECRVDHTNGGTYDRVIDGLSRLQRAADEGKIPSPEGLIVINPKHDGKRIYRHIVDDLKFSVVNFLIPMSTYAEVDDGDDVRLGDYLQDILEEHIAEGGRKIRVKIIERFLEFAVAGSRFKSSDKAQERTGSIVVAISSDGDISYDTEYKSLNLYPDNITVTNTTLMDFVNSDSSGYFWKIANTLPEDCRECSWQNYCMGGNAFRATITRYHPVSGFNARSVYCASFRRFFTLAARHLMANGLSKEQLLDALDISETTCQSAFPSQPASVRKSIRLNQVA